MPARASWRGFLQINQLQMPVKAFSAVSSQPEISLNQLHRNCCQRIRQQKVCPSHGVVSNDDIVSGFEYARDQFLPIEDDELESLAADDSKAIAIDAFVDCDHIDPIYHSGRTYYLVPDTPPGQRPFCVLRDGMRGAGRQAVARVVMSRRELPVLLRPMGRLLAMAVLEFPQRIRPAADYETEVSQFTAGPHEQQLIEEVIAAMSDDGLEIADYRDKYTDGLNELIQRRLAQAPAAAGSLEIANDGEEDLIAALRRALSDTRPERTATRLSPASRDDVTTNANRRTG